MNYKHIISTVLSQASQGYLTENVLQMELVPQLHLQYAIYCCADDMIRQDI